MERSAASTVITFVVLLLVLIALGIGLPFLFGAGTSGMDAITESSGLASVVGGLPSA